MDAGGKEMRKILWIPAFAGMTLLLISAFHASAAAENYAYAPDGCEFRMEFPGEPYNARKCSPDNPDICRDLTSFTKVFGMDATVNVNVSCNPAPPQMFEQYNADVMQATLSAMLGQSQLAEYQTAYQEFKDVAKEAVLLGMGTTGNSDRVYVAQLWIGHKSVFNVEAEVIGKQTPEADKMFAAILQSIRHESWPKPGEKTETAKETPAPAADAAPQDKKKEKNGK